MTSGRLLVLIIVAQVTFATARVQAQEFHLHSFEKLQLTEEFYSEGATFGDIDGDGEMDVIAGPFWYEGPDFEEKHAYYEPEPFDPKGYSDNFLAYTYDFNGDDRLDILIIGFPGEDAYWYKNPGEDGLDEHWERHVALDVVDNESPDFVDLTGDGVPEIVCSQEGYFGYGTPDLSNPEEPWEFRRISEQITGGRFTHGLGVGDINGDGRMDLIEKNGWLEQPESLEGDPVWERHEVSFAQEGADMFAYDVDGDGDNDVITAQHAHGFGLLWHEQVERDGEIAFETHQIISDDPSENRFGVSFSQLHALDLADMDGDGLKDIITGKRWWAHGGNDPEGNEPAVVYWFRLTRDEEGEVEFVPKPIDDDSGVGTQVVVGDVNDDDLPDVVVGNKKGVFVHLHERDAVSEDEWYWANLPGMSGTGLTPERAAAAMSVPEGFHSELIAGEPDLHQPIAFAIDHRGRLWVAENYSYPHWAPTGNDRILVFEDTNGDGTYNEQTVFYDELNFVSGLEVGFGGVWVGSPPNLLFIPDADGDAVPDGEPRVLLNGWGHDDTHETLNSFSWGPDGWLYGTHGVFTHSNVGKPGASEEDRQPINAGVWRYHPTRHEFEVFAHGTSNPWGIDFNDRGQAFITACVIPHMYHVIQGGRYQRQAGSHFNAHTYDDIQNIGDHVHWSREESWAVARGGHDATSQAGGGHAHAGAMIYLGDNWPEEYRDTLFMNNIHGNRVNRDIPERSGSGYVGRHADDFLLANDTWFRGLDLQYGPDGGVFISDWYDKKACHQQRPQDRTNGRIFKVTYGDPEPVRVDLTQLSDEELVELQLHENEWYVRHARTVLQHRAAEGELDGDTHAGLRRIVEEHADVTRRLRALWALHVTGGHDVELAMRLLDSEEEYLRAWMIQLMAEDGAVSDSALPKMAAMSRDDESPVVRLYLAAALQRLPVEQRWAIADGLVRHSGDADDHNIPMMIWYGVEPLVAADAERAMELAAASRIPRVRQFIIRRAASDPGEMGPVISLLNETDDSAAQEMILDEMVRAIENEANVPMPDGWSDAYERLIDSGSTEVRDRARFLAVRFGDERVFPMMRRTLADEGAGLEDRQRAMEVLLSGEDEQAVPILHDLLDEPALRQSALRGLASYSHPDTPGAILRHYDSFEPDEKQDAINTLTSRPSYATALLEAVERSEVERGDLTAYHIRQMQRLDNEQLNRRINETWGTVRGTSADKSERIAEYRQMLTPDVLKEADLSHGRVIFNRTCMACHELYDAGSDLGPDLTGSNRRDLDYLLENIVDPNAVIGRDYQLTVVHRKDGSIVAGMIRRETDTAVTVQTLTERTVVAKDTIAEMDVSPVSMMPERQLDVLEEEEVRDLIAYLQSPSQVPLPGEEPVFDPDTGRARGAIEGEALKVLDQTGGAARTQSMGGFEADRWSGDSHLWWTGAQPGDRLTLELPIEEAGRYSIGGVLTKARDYGVFRFHLDGEPLGDPLDLYNRPRDGRSDVITTGIISLGERELDEGPHELTVELVGANPDAVKQYMFGLDFIRLTPVE